LLLLVFQTPTSFGNIFMARNLLGLSSRSVFSSAAIGLGPRCLSALAMPDHLFIALPPGFLKSSQGQGRSYTKTFGHRPAA